MSLPGFFCPPAVAVVTAMLALSGPAGAATDAMAACDAQAADPFDPARPLTVPGVPYDQIDPTEAIAACVQAVAASPGSARAQYQLGIGLYAAGNLTEAATQFDTALTAGHDAAGYWLAMTLDYLDYDDPGAIGQLIRDSAIAGYEPAQAELDAGGAATVAQLDLTRFEQPDLVVALMSGDVGTLIAFRSGLPFEGSGLPIGLTQYLQGFTQELSGLFLCPTLLPVGLETTLQRYVANRTWKPSTAMSIVRELPGIFADVADATRAITSGRSGGLTADEIAAPGTELMAMKIEIETLKQQLEAEGRRDARLFHEMTQCTGPEADALASSATVLILALSEE